MSDSKFIFAVTTKRGRLLGIISASKYGAKQGELEEQWKAFCTWRKEAATRTILTDTEKKAMSEDIVDSFGQFLYMQRDGYGWSYTSYTGFKKGILKTDE